MRPKTLTMCLTVSVLFGVAVIMGCAADLATVQKRLEPHYFVHRPTGPGPFPAIMLVPGCSGVRPGGSTARIRTAEELRDQGFFVIFVDYVSARGLQSACRDEVSLDEVAQDVMASASYLNSQSSTPISSVGVIGWSLGGGAVLSALASLRQDKSPPLQAAAVYYPICQWLRPWRVRIPALLLLGELDEITPPGPCKDLVNRVPGESPTKLRIYPSAHHSFDIPGLAVGRSARLGGRTVGYNQQAAVEAWREVTEFFRQYLPRN